MTRHAFPLVALLLSGCITVVAPPAAPTATAAPGSPAPAPLAQQPAPTATARPAVPAGAGEPDEDADLDEGFDEGFDEDLDEDFDPADEPTRPRPPANGTTAGTTRPVAGQVRGHVTDAAGDPLPGVTIELYGTTGMATDLDGRVVTDENGDYAITDVPDGNYQVQAWTEASYNGQSWYLPADPTTGTAADRIPLGGGITRDFVWRIAGRKPGKPDASDPASYYGAQFEVYGSDAYGGQVAAQSGGTLEVTLEPDGPLMDGSAGETIEASLPFVNTGVPLELINDVPLGNYTLSATLVQGGVATPMKVSTVGNGAEDYFPSVRVQPKDSGVNFRPYQNYPVTKTKVYLLN